MADGPGPAASHDLIVANVLMDTIVSAAGNTKEVDGGAGLYALAGAALFAEAPVLVTGAGKDVVTTFGRWMVRNGLTQAGLRLADAHTPRNLLRYTNETVRTETPVYGPEHFMRMQPTPADVETRLPGARSAYVFRNAEAAFWSGLRRLRERHDLFVLWEIAEDACTPAERDGVESILVGVDALSLNLGEARSLFEAWTDDAIVARLQSLPQRCSFLRLGRRGSLAVTMQDAVFVPSVPAPAVDVTGAGNAYSGAALVGLADGRSTVAAAQMGAVAAAFTIAQPGPPEAQGLRAEARKRLSELTSPIQESL